MKLLIVDDQSTVVQGLLHCTNWAAMGFTEVDTALNAVDAKASLLRQEAEVMLCDIEMPMESGLDLLDWLRQRGMTTRCIFLTAHAEFKYAQEALRLGGFDYIMQPAPYEQVADAVSRALDNVKEEWAALELQSRGAVFDDQKKEIVETMLRGFLLGNAPGSSLTAFEELSLVPRREQECWVALMQPLRWKQGEEPWELSLLSTAVGNMSSEVFTPLQMLFSLPEKKRQDDMFREPEALELYRNGMKTVPDMKALVHYVASVWDSETEENSQSTVEVIMAYIAEHLENELRREELAEAVHLNPDYMARLFKKETGMNLKDYIIQQKMQEAQSLLCTTNLPISLIAAKVGYTNFGHFSTSYKKFYHKTPQEERSAAL